MESLSPGAADKRIKFANPPINELVIALFYLPIMEMKSQHIGLYWNRIRDRYPLSDIEQPLPGRNLIYLAYFLPKELEDLSS